MLNSLLKHLMKARKRKTIKYFKITQFNQLFQTKKMTAHSGHFFYRLKNLL